MTEPNGFSADHAMLTWVQEIAPYGIFTTDRELRIRSWNQWLVTHSGFSADEIVGRTLAEAYPDLKGRGLYERFNRALHGEISVLSTALHRYLLPMPAPIPATGHGQMLQTARVAPLPQDGAIVGTITIIEDVTQREFQAGVLHRQQEIDRLLSLALATLLQSDDPAREVSGIFSSLALVLGLDAYFSHLLSADGKRLELSASGGILPKQQEAIATLWVREADRRALGEAGATDLNIGGHADMMRSLGLRGHCSIPLGVGERVIGMVSFGSYAREAMPPADVKILVRIAGYIGLAIDRAMREREMLAASKAKDNFLAALSHELRTPLNPVLLLASDSKDNLEFSEDARDIFRIIEKNILLEARLIDDLLDLTRIAHGKLNLELREVDLHAAVRDAIATVRTEANERHLALEVDLKAEPSLIAGDAGRLQQVFWNILKNAVKFTPTGGRISVRSETIPGARQIRVEVADSGIGMGPAELARVFNAFSQGDHAEQGHRFGGLGLGLAIGRTLVELHSGRIEARSGGKDQGSIFRVDFPLLAPGGRADAADFSGRTFALTAKAPPTKERRRILLVEDHEPTRRALDALLTRREYEVVAVASASGALSEAAKAKFDLVLSDIGLPDGHGLAVMQSLRDRYGIRGIALTGYGMEDDIVRSGNSGVVTHLTKPVSVEVLDRALAAAFSNEPR